MLIDFTNLYQVFSKKTHFTLQLDRDRFELTFPSDFSISKVLLTVKN